MLCYFKIFLINTVHGHDTPITWPIFPPNTLTHLITLCNRLYKRIDKFTRKPSKHYRHRTRQSSPIKAGGAVQTIDLFTCWQF